ncbi:MAG: efflux transporter outer membrane subunit [Holosporaceae bacterium]|jgi:multidrug efflux system outer membrane protein|nr:efflux transporter outer membrane subunit [Holosporaceae bacterium]
MWAYRKTGPYLAVLAVLLVGCQTGPDYKRPKISMPQLKVEKNIEEYVQNRWWQVFSDKTLSELEEQAIKYNEDIKQAVANMEIAMALAGITVANFFPSLGISGEGTKSCMSKNGTAAPLAAFMKSRTTRDYSTAAAISYEIDFFGKYRRANEAAQADLLASKAFRDSVLLTVTAEVAKTYFLLRALDAKLAIARRTFDTRQKTCAVYDSLFQNGYCTELDYWRVQSEMSSIKAVVLDLEAAVARAENALSVLIGANPREMVVRRTAKDQAIEKMRIPSEVPSGIPSDMLARRPDIQQAEGLLISANAKVGVAKAAHFPSISLTGIFGFESMNLARLFNAASDVWNLNGGIALPLFNGGKISEQNRAAEANYRRMLAGYGKAVQTAFRETLDALVSNRKNREIVISRTRQVNSMKRSYEIAKKQKESGLIGLLDLLDVERGLLASEMDLVSALQNQLTAVVDLCKALGGGWKSSDY